MPIGLKGLSSLVDFSSFPPRETTFVTFCLLHCAPGSLLKDVYSKKQEFAPERSNFFYI